MTVPVRNYLIEVNHPVSIGGAGGETFDVDLDPTRCDYVTDEGVEVWIERKRQKTRFLDAAGNQVGPVHSNLVPAIIYASFHGWRDPSRPAWFTNGLIAEVRSGGVIVDKHGTERSPQTEKEVGELFAAVATARSKSPRLSRGAVKAQLDAIDDDAQQRRREQR